MKFLKREIKCSILASLIGMHSASLKCVLVIAQQLLQQVSQNQGASNLLMLVLWAYLIQIAVGDGSYLGKFKLQLVTAAT